MSSTVVEKPRTGLTRQLAWYFGGLIATYAAGLAIFWPPSGEQPSTMIFLVLMFAPTVGAVLARLLGGGRIQWGRPSWWILAGLIPAVSASRLPASHRQAGRTGLSAASASLR